MRVKDQYEPDLDKLTSKVLHGFYEVDELPRSVRGAVEDRVIAMQLAKDAAAKKAVAVKKKPPKKLVTPLKKTKKRKVTGE